MRIYRFRLGNVLGMQERREKRIEYRRGGEKGGEGAVGVP